MTQEQYFWFRRQQLLRAWQQQQRAQFAGNAIPKSYHFEPVAGNSQLFKYTSDGAYDEDKVNALFEDYAYPVAAGRCSSVRSGNFHGRNYDWYFDQAPTFIVRTPATETRHKTLGVATLMHLKASEVKDGYNKMYEFLECAIVDGINDAGLVCNLNVCPPGDNPNYPTLADEARAQEAGVDEKVLRNITYETNPGQSRRFVGMICRTLLDNFASCAEVKERINDWSWYAARNPESSFQEEFHCMVSDREKTLVIEFVENHVVIHEWSADGTYTGCTDAKYKIGSQVKPIMTNFYLSKWDGDLENLGISKEIPVADRNKTVTEYGMGYERYAKINDAIELSSVEDTMKHVSYRQIYNSLSDEWVSEFLLRENHVNYRADLLNSGDFADFRERAKLRCNAEDEDNAMGIRPLSGVTWQSVHSATYDINALSVHVFSQEIPDESIPGQYKYVSSIEESLN